MITLVLATFWTGFLGIFTFLWNNPALILAVLGIAATVFQTLNRQKALQVVQVMTHVIEDFSQKNNTTELKQAVANIAKPAGLNDIIETVLDNYVRKEFPPQVAPTVPPATPAVPQ
jgi:hypothetical protein